LGAIDGDDDPLAGCGCAAVAAPRDGEWEDDRNEEEDSFDEKTFVSGTILTHFRVNVRRRSVEKPGFAAILEEAQGMYSVGGPDADASVPEPVTFAFGRGGQVIVGVGVGNHKCDSTPMPMFKFKFKFLSGLRLVRVGGGPRAASAIVSGIAILIVSRLRGAF
jgi:hypothetical protein